MSAATEIKGKRFGRYVLLGHLADGGMASVYLAQLRGNNRFAKWAALKVVHARHAHDERFRKMFLTEARIVAQIDHPNVATVFDCGEEDGTYYLAMEYLSGQTLRKVCAQAVLRDRPVPLPLAARIIADAALGLHAAHELRNEDGQSAGIVHRDVSPHNIFVLYNGATKVMDFGIAFSNTRSDDEHTEIDELKGKIAYMSPEQLQRFPLDRRSDIYSLGIVLWELLTGSRLYKRRSEGEIAMAIMQGQIDPPSKLRHDCPPQLDQIALKALQRRPEDRYETAADLAADLEDFIISTGRAAGAQMLREYMHELFAGEIEEHSTSLRKASELVRQLEAELALVSVTISNEGPTLEVEAVHSEPPPRKSGVAAWISVGVALVALAASLWTVARSWQSDGSETASGEVATPPASVAAPPVVEAQPTADATAAGTAQGVDVAPPATTERAAAAPPAAQADDADDDRRRGWRRPVARPTPRAGGSDAPAPAREAAPSPSSGSSSSGSHGPRPMTEFE